jgi:hypothetical protein
MRDQLGLRQAGIAIGHRSREVSTLKTENLTRSTRSDTTKRF